MTVYVSTLIDWLGEAGIAATLTGARDVPVEQLTFDSRAVAAGSLFAALPGSRVDGHDFIDRALAAQASALLVQRSPRTPHRVPTLVVEDTARALAVIAARFFGPLPACLQAVTGTNGENVRGPLRAASLWRRKCGVGWDAWYVTQRLVRHAVPDQSRPDRPGPRLSGRSGVGPKNRNRRGLVPRFGSRPPRRLTIRRCRLYQSQSRSSGLSSHDGKLLARQAAPVYGSAQAPRRRRHRYAHVAGARIG